MWIDSTARPSRSFLPRELRESARIPNDTKRSRHLFHRPQREHSQKREWGLDQQGPKRRPASSRRKRRQQPAQDHAEAARQDEKHDLAVYDVSPLSRRR